MFSHMNRVKNDWSTTFALKKTVPQIKILILTIHNEKVWRAATTKPHNYPEKRRKLVGNSSTSVDVVKYCMSDFESDSSGSDDK